MALDVQFRVVQEVLFEYAGHVLAGKVVCLTYEFIPVLYMYGQNNASLWLQWKETKYPCMKVLCFGLKLLHT